MSTKTESPPAVSAPPPQVNALTILSQYPPGVWIVILGYTDGSTSKMGLTTDHVQYWIDTLGGVYTDNTQGQSFPNVKGGTVASVVKTTSKVIHVDVADATQVKSS